MNKKRIVLILFVLVKILLLLNVVEMFNNALLKAQHINVKSTKKLSKIKSITDTTKKKSLQKIKDSTNKKLDTNTAKVDSNDIPESYYLMPKRKLDSGYKPFLDSTVSYSSTDSATFHLEEKEIYLYKDAESDYAGMKSKGDIIKFEQANKNITLLPFADSNNNIRIRDKTKFQQNGTEFLNDTAVFNLQSKKGLVSNSFTTQGDMFIWSELSKKVNEDDIYATGARFTTCGLDHPHFAFRSKKAKFRNKKVGVTNVLYPEIEGVRFNIPLLPFAIFPLITGARSGVLFPNLIQRDDAGYGLENLGYYFNISDYVNLTVLGSIYTFGSYGGNASSVFKKKYAFNGTFNANYNNWFTGIPGDTVRNRTTTYSIQLNASTDPKLMPNAGLSANINWQSSSYNSFVVNNAAQNFQNQINSSLNYNQRWKRVPMQLNLSGNHSMNSQTKYVNLSFPSLNFSLQNLSPLEQVGKQGAWYQKLSIKYDVTASSQTNWYDTAFNPLAKDNFRYGARHTPSISLPLPPLGPFIFQPSISYNETWTDKRSEMKYAPDGKTIDTTIEKGLFRFNSVSFSLSASTNIYGTWLFKKSSPLRGIRHVMRPNVSYSYQPNVNAQNFYNLEDPNKATYTRISRFNGTNVNPLYGAPAETEFSGLNFSLSNSLEIKVRDRKDTAKGTRNVSIIDNFTISGNYNLTQDTNVKQRMSNINMNLTSKLTDKISINASGVLDPYDSDTLGARKTNFAWQRQNQPFSLGRLTSFNLSTSFSLNGGEQNRRRKILTQKISDAESLYKAYLYHDTTQFSSYKNPFDNWSIAFSYAISYNSVFDRETKQYGFDLSSHNIGINGSLATTKTWKISYGTQIRMYDFGSRFFEKMDINYVTLSVSKDLHCWLIDVSIVPVGIVKSIAITLRPKSSILADAKITKNRYYRNN